MQVGKSSHASGLAMQGTTGGTARPCVASGAGPGVAQGPTPQWEERGPGPQVLAQEKPSQINSMPFGGEAGVAEPARPHRGSAALAGA